MLVFLGRTLRWALVLSAYLYLAGVTAFTVFVRGYATDSWFGALALYAPRHVFLVPIVCLALGLVLVKRRNVLWTQALALGVVLFPLMGLMLPGPPVYGLGSQTIRVLSFNVDSGFSGVPRIVETITRIDADIVAIQEA
ncbi:MAG TPA: hypothetical protein VFU02_01675, partial [Polyangiaceae bacterium]|nr:hypothetical protein [Polyangiaceae bacterium]